MAEQTKLELDDELMNNVAGGTDTRQPFAFSIGDRVTLQYYDQIGIITDAYCREYGNHFYNMYNVHWLPDPYNQEHDSKEVLECNLKRA